MDNLPPHPQPKLTSLPDRKKPEEKNLASTGGLKDDVDDAGGGAADDVTSDEETVDTKQQKLSRAQLFSGVRNFDM